MVLTYPRTVNKLKKLNSCYFWISKAILFTLTYYIVTVWISVKCVILLKSEHLNVPLFIDLAVEFNLLKSTSGLALQDPPPPPPRFFLFLPKPLHLNIWREPGSRGTIPLKNKYSSILNESTPILLRSLDHLLCILQVPGSSWLCVTWKGLWHTNPCHSAEQQF